MFENLQQLPLQLEELDIRLNDPNVIQDQKLWQKLMQERRRIEPIAECYRRYTAAVKEIEDMKHILDNEKEEELRQMAKDELLLLQETEQKTSKELLTMMLPSDPRDERDVFMELRQGAGGDEAGLFASDLFRMYSRYAENRGWKISVLSVNESGLGGFKEIIFKIEGDHVYSRMKFESGVHRVQRIPATESGGRIHTSTVTAAVMAEADEVEIEIRPEDIRVDVYRSSGHGGQSVNTTDSAVRVTHIPTGMVVTCQDEKSQLKNRDQALRVLRARLLEAEKKKQHEKMSTDKRSQVGTGERSEKIRTYNFPQNRITDHRINYTTHRIFEIMNGDLDELLDRLIEDEQSKKLQQAQNET